MKAENGLPVKEGFLIAMLAAVNFTHIMDFVIMAPLNPFFKSAMNINTKEFGYMVSVYTFAAAIGAVFAFFKIDQYDRRKSMIFLYAGFFIANLLCALAPGYKFFILARFFAGLFGGVLNVLIMSVIGDVIPLERRGKATGMVMAAFAGASVIGIPSGLMLAKIFDYHAPFWLLAVLSGLVGIVLLLKFPSLTRHMEAKDQRTPPLQILKEFSENTNIKRALVFVFLLMVAGFSVVPFISDYMVFNVGLNKEELFYIYLFGGLATVVSGPLVGRLADKFGRVKVFVIAALISIGPIIMVTMLPAWPLVYVLCFTTVFFICFGSRFVPAMTLVTSCVPPLRRGSFLSISTCIQQLGSGVAVVIASAIIVNEANGRLTHFEWVGAFAAVATVLCILVSLKIKEVS